jgi:hypothetical protein
MELAYGFDEKGSLVLVQVEPNTPCNCGYAFGAHGSISRVCPDRKSFFTPKAVTDGR